MKRWHLLAIVVSLLAASPAAAQMGPDDEGADYYVDNPLSLAEARESGQGMRIGQGYRSRVIPETYTVRRGDTLWDVTGSFYGNPWEWPRVWSYNPEITNPHWIYPLDRLRLLPAGTEQEPSQAPAVQLGARARVTSPPRARRQGIFLREEAFLDTDALQRAGTVVGSPDDQLLLSVYDAVYVQFAVDEEGREPEVRPGMEVSIFHQLLPEERAQGETGQLVRIFGTARIETYDRDTRIARALITEALDPIERGYLVADVPRRFDDVPARRNAIDLDAHIAALIRPRTLIGENQIVFLDVGAEEGVQVGNRFVVLRHGDVLHESLPSEAMNPGVSLPVPRVPAEVPNEVIAELRVVHVRPHTCTAVVSGSVLEVELHDLAKMREGY